MTVDLEKGPESSQDLAVAFAPFAHKMQQAGLPELAIEAFRRHYRQLVQDKQGVISEQDLIPCGTLPDLEQLPDYSQVGVQALERCVMIKLNGGLGTGMGLQQAKSLLPVKEDRSFLDVIARHVLQVRQQYGVQFPLLLMNSFKTEADTLALLTQYPTLAKPGWPLSFVQSQVPRVAQADLQPVNWPANPELEWCPPGHGDIYTSLVTSGWLQKMLEAGYEYAYVSNADNLGSMLDVEVLGYFAQSGTPFMMEVADRKPGDRKGGHLGRYRDGRWMLRELAQCPPDEQESFQDITKHSYFNTNNIWWHLPSLWQKLAEYDYILPLPLIRNCKTIDSTRPNSPAVYQLETAVGSALELFEKAAVLRVPRRRQIAVKHWSELIVIWSDAFVTTPQERVVLNPACQGHQPLVSLDERYFKLEQDIRAHFPYGIPSLVDCRSLRIEGDITFGRKVQIVGEVVIKASAGPAYVPDNTVLTGEVILD